MDQSQGASEQSENTSGNESQSNETLDWAQMLAEQQAHNNQTIKGLQQELGQSRETLGRLKKAFVPENEENQNPYKQKATEYEQFMDYFLQQGLEAERAGKPMPLTVTLGTKLAQFGIESEARAEKLEQELSEIKRQLKRQQNPAWQGLERAGQVMEGMLDEALTQMYGEDPKTAKVRNSQFNAVMHRVNEEIQDLMKNDPDTLLKIQRNPKHMRKMVNHFMTEMLPPAVRQRIEEDHLKNTEPSVQELYAAFAEAREQKEQAEGKENFRAAQEYSRLMDEIRQQILGMQFGGRRSEQSPSLNRLLTGPR